MKVQVNNKEVEITPGSTLTQLTMQLELPVQGIAIAVNNKMIPRTEWERFVLHENDNLAIIKALRNGRASFRDIAADLGLSEVTVRTRAARLIEDGVLDICGQVDVEKLPGHTLALVAIKLRSPDLVGEGEVFSHLRGVVSVAVLTGRHDLILTVLLNEEFGLLDFYTNEFSKCHDRVSSIETFIVYKGFSLKVPYIL